MTDLQELLVLIALFFGMSLLFCAGCYHELLRGEEEEKPNHRKAN